jgi:hypothetical protein
MGGSSGGRSGGRWVKSQGAVKGWVKWWVIRWVTELRGVNLPRRSDARRPSPLHSRSAHCAQMLACLPASMVYADSSAPSPGPFSQDQGPPHPRNIRQQRLNPLPMRGKRTADMQLSTESRLGDTGHERLKEPPKGAEELV